MRNLITLSPLLLDHVSKHLPVTGMTTIGASIFRELMGLNSGLFKMEKYLELVTQVVVISTLLLEFTIAKLSRT